MLLFLSKHTDQQWTPKVLKEKLLLDLNTKEIHEGLELLAQADLIQRGVSDIEYQGLEDSTINLILRNRFEEEISIYSPDL